jgi:hypothetical protein
MTRIDLQRGVRLRMRSKPLAAVQKMAGVEGTEIVHVEQNASAAHDPTSCGFAYKQVLAVVIKVVLIYTGLATFQLGAHLFPENLITQNLSRPNVHRRCGKLYEKSVSTPGGK